MMPIPTARRLRRLAILPALAVGTLGLAASLHTGAATAASVTTVSGAGAGPTDPSWTVTTPSVAATPATLGTTAFSSQPPANSRNSRSSSGVNTKATVVGIAGPQISKVDMTGT